MIPGVEDLYHEIGQQIYDLGPEGFSEALARVEMIEDVESMGIFFKLPDNTYKYCNEGIYEILDSFRSLREKFKEFQGEGWSSATFHLNSQGKMNLEVGYEDVSDFGLAPERRSVWIKNHLGENPKIDWS